MIFDRTAQDVVQAEQLFNEKVKAFLPLTDAEENIMERGRVTVGTLNRIEQKQAEIALQLKDWGYIKEILVNKEWNAEVFFQEDLERLVENTKALRNSFFVITTSLKNPDVRFFYEDFNRMEQILSEIWQLIEAAKATFKYSGALNANQTILPLKGA